jgi:RNA polymerase sigma factor (TIGR02999 family)
MADPPDDPRVTSILRDMGAAGAGWELALPQLYGELRSIADQALRRVGGAHSVEPTSLVHEAWARLAAREGWEDREHFLAVAATAMRGILVDLVRARQAERRGGDWKRVTLDSRIAERSGRGLDLLDLHDALDELVALDPRHGRIVELRAFGGMTLPEVARVLGISLTSAETGWRCARAWLRGRIGGAA